MGTRNDFTLLCTLPQRPPQCQPCSASPGTQAGPLPHRGEQEGVVETVANRGARAPLTRAAPARCCQTEGWARGARACNSARAEKRVCVSVCGVPRGRLACKESAKYANTGKAKQNPSERARAASLRPLQGRSWNPAPPGQTSPVCSTPYSASHPGASQSTLLATAQACAPPGLLPQPAPPCTLPQAQGAMLLAPGRPFHMHPTVLAASNTIHPDPHEHELHPHGAPCPRHLRTLAGTHHQHTACPSPGLASPGSPPGPITLHSPAGCCDTQQVAQVLPASSPLGPRDQPAQFIAQ